MNSVSFPVRRTGWPSCPIRVTRRGLPHALAPVLLPAACAALASARSCLAIGQWARHAPQDTLARLGFMRETRSVCTLTVTLREVSSTPFIRPLDLLGLPHVQSEGDLGETDIEVGSPVRA